MSKRALITGITGQDGSFLAELLLAKGYGVTGLVHGGTDRPLGCSEHLRESIELISGDLLVPETLRAAIGRARPDELYHLAAPSFIPESWRQPMQTLQAIAGSTAAILEALRDLAPETRVFLAASGAMFGEAPECPQRETTPCHPTTPYGVAKLAAHLLVGTMRRHYGLFACSGIVFNHESERRPKQFVTRAVTQAAAKIKLGLADEVRLGDLSAVRDWSFAGDIVQGAWLCLQQDEPDDYVLASGVGHTVAELVDVAFACVGLDPEPYVKVDGALVRTAEQTPPIGDPSHARATLGWEPRVGFEQLVQRMVQADLDALATTMSRGARS